MIATESKTPPTARPKFSDAEICAIGEAFADCSLPKAQWTHAGHFAAALWLVTHPDYDAERDMPAMIRRYNRATGVANTDISGYHHSITLASLRVTAHHVAIFRAESGAGMGQSLSALFDGLMAGPFADKGWILKHWRRETLFTPEARRGWVAPDLKPLPGQR